MGLPGKLERRLKRFAIPNLTLTLVAGQVVFYIASFANPQGVAMLELVPSRVMAGEVWRLVSFMLLPPRTNPLFAFFQLYLFWLMGTALERQWGEFRYNLYLLIGWAATAGVAFVTPHLASTNIFLYGSVFLAFAYLYPDFQLLLMFFIPIKIRYLAIIAWAGYALLFARGDTAARLAVAAGVGNFLLFFGGDIVSRIYYHHRGLARRTRADKLDRKLFRNGPMHRCAVCGATDADPDMDFRYCAECRPTTCYCINHIHDHEHQRGK